MAQPQMASSAKRTRSRSTGATVSSDLVQMLLQSADVGPTTVRRALSRVGIDPAVLTRPYLRIDAERFALLWDEIESSANDPHFGLHLGELRFGLPGGHVLLAAMSNSDTVGQAIGRFCRYHDIMADVAQPRIALRNDRVVLSVSVSRPGIRLHRQHVECLISVAVSLLRHLSRGRFQGEVHFAHEKPENDSEHRRILGPSLHFGDRVNALVFDRSFMETSIPAADPELAGLLDRYAAGILRRIRSHSPWTEKVVTVVGRVLADGKPQLAEVARKLAASPRSLQDKLRAESTSYQEILDRVRKDAALEWLRESDLPAGEIAFLLGFADQSAFNRAFKKWTGTSPLSFRNNKPRSSTVNEPVKPAK